ncbi:probable serine/threonine-protein kinase At1g54610 [Papaver somniferum]|nr:probable serine/threonine-protein kinase At1g54610 [Papaver somniferum]
MILRKLEGLITSRLSTSVYLVFEYTEHDIAGLSSCLDIKFSESQVKCYMHQLLSGLEHCHSRGIMHSNIKGSNLLVSDDGALKIADFGLKNFVSVGHIQPLTSRVVTLWVQVADVVDWADLGSRGRTKFAGEGSKEVQQQLQESMRGSVAVVATEVQCRERGSGDGSDCRPEYKEKRGFPLQISEIQ